MLRTAESLNEVKENEDFKESTSEQRFEGR